MREPSLEDDLERALEKEMDNMQSTETEDIEMALEKEMDNMQTMTQDDAKVLEKETDNMKATEDIEKALEKEMDNMQTMTQEDAKVLEKETDNMKATEDIEKALEKEMDNMQTTTQEDAKVLEKETDNMKATEDIEKALEKEMDNMQTTTQEKLKAGKAETQLDATKVTEDDLETSLDRELDSTVPGKETELDEDDLEKELERAMDELNDVEMRAAEEEVQGDVQTPSKEAKERSSPKSTKKSPQKDHFVDESRFMEDKDGNRIYKWKVDYASRGGGGRAMCRDKDCLERRDQAGVASIEKGALRIGRRIQGVEGDLIILWYHARCIFNSFTRARKSTRIIESTDDLEGFDDIRPEDQELLRKVIAGQEDLRTANFGSSDRGQGNKRGAEEPAVTAAKRRREEEKVKKQVDLSKGSRVWTFVNVRGTDRDGQLISKKSSKPELGMIVEEEKDGFFTMQFESKEHETERLEMQSKKRYRRLSAWLRYPRVFEGPPQKVAAGYIRRDRPPPKLCGCKLQEWAHGCPCTGITCTRGSTQKVWGVGQ